VQGLTESGKQIVFKLKNKQNRLGIVLGLFIFLMNIAFAFNANHSKKIPLLLEVTINQQKQPSIFECYEDRSGNIFVNEKDLQQWHFPIINKMPVNFSGKKYYSLKWYKSISFKLNKKTLQLSIWIPSGYYPANNINLLRYNPNPIRPAMKGLFLNYDLTSIDNTQSSYLTNAALLDMGLFNHFGVGTNSLLISNYNAISNTNPGYHAVRLNTTWTLDEPEKIATWRLGDSITGASTWSGSARFGGIQYATNFNTQPNFITFPLPGIKGEAIVPTNVQIFVNGILNQRKSIENGVYNITNIPVVTGAGTVNVVSQDLLGRTQTISLPYYASPNLLKSGLSDYSYEMGFLRENYGIDSNDYSELLVTATWQRGLSDRLTVGTHAELLSMQQTMGASMDYLFKRLGVISFALAQSHSQFGGGSLGSIGFSRQTPTVNAGFKSTFMSTNYQQIGIQTGESGPLGAVTTNQVFFGYDTGLLGSFGLSYTMTKQFSVPNAISNPGPQIAEIATLSYSRGVFKSTTFSLSAITDLHDSDNNQFYASLIISLDNLHSVSAYVNYQNHQTQPGVLYTRNLPLGDGYGYHVLATTAGTNGPGADFTYQNEIGTYSARAYHIAHKNYYEGDISGAILYFDHHPFLSRRLQQSFALVQVPGYENIRVYYQNQLIGKTNQDGNLLVPEILPYQENTLAIEPRDLPFTAEIQNTSMTVLPYYHSGAIARFNVKKSFHLRLQLMQKNGDYVPVGSDAILDNNAHYLVGYEGTLFITMNQYRMIRGKVIWANKVCSFKVANPNHLFDTLRKRNVLCS